MSVARHLHPPIGFVVQPTNHSPLGFDPQNQETMAVILWVKSPNRSYWF
jgi:hypothetical protein